MKKFFNICLQTLVVTGLFTACNPERLKDVDVSEVKTEPAKILRLENDVFATPPDSFRVVSKKMQAKYHNFYNSFIFNIVNHGEERDSVFKALKLFVLDKDMQEVYEAVKKTYTDSEIKKLEKIGRAHV